MTKAAIIQRLTALGVGIGAAIAGAFLIIPNEGEVLGTYVDPVGILTACYGQTGTEIQAGQKYSRDECMAMLADDLATRDRQMRSLVTVELSPGEHAAYLSLAYNIGINNFKGSTLIKHLNNDRRHDACQQIMRWVFAGGKDCRIRSSNCYGIVVRREQELAMCLGHIPLDLDR